MAALAALALPAAAFCGAAGRYVPTYDAEKAWYLGELGVTNLLNAGITGKGVRVGVIDLGVGDIVTGAHTNLHCAAKGGKSMRAMHGPAVAGIIASDLYGVAPECEIYAYDNGDGTADDLIAGFAWCVSNGCRVINYSGGMHRFSRGVGNLSEEAAAAKLEELRAAVRAAMSAGIVVVASGGNAPNETLTCPQDVDGVINIGGVARTRKSAGLNDSWAKDFCAFGKDVPIFTSRSGATGVQSGSSFAAPMATGIIASCSSRSQRSRATRYTASCAPPPCGPRAAGRKPTATDFSRPRGSRRTTSARPRSTPSGLRSCVRLRQSCSTKAFRGMRSAGTTRQRCAPANR